jgi:hypothetical protein
MPKASRVGEGTIAQRRPEERGYSFEKSIVEKQLILLYSEGESISLYERKFLSGSTTIHRLKPLTYLDLPLVLLTQDSDDSSVLHDWPLLEVGSSYPQAMFDQL